MRKKTNNGLGAFVLLILAALCIKVVSSPRCLGSIKALADSLEGSSVVQTPDSSKSNDAEPHEESGEQAPSSSNPAVPEQEEGSIIYSGETLLLQIQAENKDKIPFTDVSGFNSGTLKIHNQTSFEPDYGALLSESLKISQNLPTADPAVLIIHTHGSEAYTPTAENDYVQSDTDRTEDTRYNVVRVGDEVEAVLKDAGIGVIHEPKIFDYPTYNGSYTRTLKRIEELLQANPSIQIVLDIHRDAVTNPDGTPYGSVCTLDGEECAQVMLVVGTGEGGLPHPDWKENLKLALQIERVMQVKYEGLTRYLNLRTERFNQHATLGSLIIEMGSNGNTLEQALSAARRFADCAVEVILQLSQNSPG